MFEELAEYGTGEEGFCTRRQFSKCCAAGHVQILSLKCLPFYVEKVSLSLEVHASSCLDVS